MSDNTIAIQKTTAIQKTAEKPAGKKQSRRPATSGDECLAASFFALKSGSIESAKKALQELNAQHAATIKFVVECGGVEDALDCLDSLAQRLAAA